MTTACRGFSAVTLCVLLLAGIHAGANPPESLSEITGQQLKLKKDIQEGRVSLSPRARRIVDEQQDIVFAVSDGKSSVSDLTADQQVRLRNALEQIDAEVAGTRLAQDDKEVCWREKRTGSKLVTTVCGTVRERREAREGARDYMQRPRICTPPDCGATP